MTTKKKEQCTIPVVVCCRCGAKVNKYALKEQEEEIKEYIKCEKHLLDYKMQEKDIYWQ